jgi:sialate O-acetylesterase
VKPLYPILTAGLIVFSFQAMTQAELVLPAILSDRMVLQREEPARIWGWTDSGKTVEVRFAGQVKSARADDNGEWLIALDPMSASAEPRTMTITDGAGTRTIKDILVGEVWQASGQSNMQWTLQGEIHWDEVSRYPENDQIRFFKQMRNPQGQPVRDTLKTIWEHDHEENRKGWSAVAYFFARDLQTTLGIPVGISLACEGGTKCQYWTPMEAFESRPEYKDYLELAVYARDHFEEIKEKYETEYQDWLKRRKAGEKVGRPPLHYGRHPVYYYNGNIHPIRHYTIRGVIWYQGERNSINTKDAFLYREYFPLMIQSWRKAFRNPDMPFYFVQLPKMGVKDRRDNPVTRESQLLTARKLENTNMIVGFDKGEASLHPKTKRFLGERLAKMALAETYGRNIEYRFPLYRRAQVNGSSITVEFDHADDGLKSSDGREIRAFTICGADKEFVPAGAEVSGNTVIVSSPEVPSPVAVRYGWDNAPDVNLVGRNGLPASPFRTDDFELPEQRPQQENYTHFQ